MTPAAHRHVAARRRDRQRRPERQPAFLVVQARQRRTAQRVEGPAAALALVAPQTPRHTARNRPFARSAAAPGLVHTKLDRGLRCLALAPARQHRERLAPLRARQPARRRKHLETLATSITQPPDVPGTLSLMHTIHERAFLKESALKPRIRYWLTSKPDERFDDKCASSARSTPVRGNERTTGFAPSRSTR